MWVPKINGRNIQLTHMSDEARMTEQVLSNNHETINEFDLTESKQSNNSKIRRHKVDIANKLETDDIGMESEQNLQEIKVASKNDVGEHHTTSNAIITMIKFNNQVKNNYK